MSFFDSFVKKHEYLVCVDSDGCVMDTMNCKHFHCFGPCMVTEWGLEEWEDTILRRWTDINLLQMTRGEAWDASVVSVKKGKSGDPGG